MKRPSVLRAALVEPVTLVVALVSVLSSNPGLPDIPITEVIPKHDELALASHGRGFWSLDNIAPLRQPQAGTTDRDLVLFTPTTAYRSANGILAVDHDRGILYVIDVEEPERIMALSLATGDRRPDLTEDA